MSTESYKGYNALLRRPWLLRRLAESDGPSYDQLCREVIRTFPHANIKYRARVPGVQSVPDLFWDELAVTAPDEAVSLTPRGWEAPDGLLADAREGGGVIAMPTRSS